MVTIAIVGDGPAGLSAALFLARAGHVARVYGTDDTAMHHALLHNYLGIEEVLGTDFQATARQQVVAAGAELLDDEVTEVHRDGEGFVVVTDGGRRDPASRVILAAAKRGGRLAEQLGLVADRGGVAVDTEGRTEIAGVYVVGRLARPGRSQAVISAGAGATAALDVLAEIDGEDVVDWDSPD